MTDKNKLVYLDRPDRYYYYFCQYCLNSYKSPWFKSDSLKNIHFNELYEVWNDYTGARHTDFNKISSVSIPGLIKQRNLEWIEIIPGLLNKGACTILVGNGHIENLSVLLTEKGYRLEPVF